VFSLDLLYKSQLQVAFLYRPRDSFQEQSPMRVTVFDSLLVIGRRALARKVSTRAPISLSS
jgi:hypothetical protein